MRTLLAPLIGLLLAGPTLAQTVVDPPDAYDFSAVTTLLNEQLDAFDDNVVVLLERDGHEIYRYEYTFTSDTKIGIASATKLISGSVVLALRDAGVFGLDENVGRPQWVPEMAAAGKDFTIRQGFVMSSGLHSQVPYEWLPLYTLEGSVAQIVANTPREYLPGTAVLYDGAGMQTVGLVAQRATGVDWRTLASVYLLGSCGMANTSYTRFSPNPAVAGGIETSPADYMKLLRAISNGGFCGDRQVLSPAAIEELFTDQNGGKPILGTPFPPNNPWYPYGAPTVTYGFGAWVLAQHPVTGEIEEILSPGAWGTSPWVDRRRGLAGIVFTNVPAGSQSALNPTLELFQRVRQIVDDVDDPVIQLNVPGENYFDPELLSSEDLIVFQDGDDQLWLAELDPELGLYANSTTGKDVLLTDRAPRLSQFWNAGEFAREQGGWSVYYSAEVDGVWRIWRAYRDAANNLVQEVLTDTTADRGGMIVSDSPELETSYVGYVRNGAQSGGEIWYFDRRAPQNERYVGPFVIGETILRWVPNRHAFVVSQRDEQDVLQLYWYDALTGQRTQITDGDVNITHPFPFEAPEYDDQLMIAASEGDQRIVILAPPESGALWQRQATLDVPEASAFDFVASPEVFTFRGRSYISLKTAARVGEVIRPAEIWLFGISDNPYARFTLRVDGGDDGPEGLGRSDPEPYVTDEEVFVVYSVVTPKYEAWRSRTGMATQALPRPGDLDGDGVVAAGDFGVLEVTWQGPGRTAPPLGGDPRAFGLSDLDDDDDVDLADLSRFQRRVNSSG